MKIVHLCLCGSVTDGWNYQDNLLTKWHHKNGHDVTIITSQIIFNDKGLHIIRESNDNDYINSDGVRTIRLPMLGGNDPSKPWSGIYEGVYSNLEKLQPEILFIHGVVPGNLEEIVRYVKRHPEMRVYVDSHADYSNSGSKRMTIKKFIRNLIPRRFLRRCALLPYARKYYGVLPARVDYLVKEYRIPREKCELLLMGADDDLVNEAKKPEVIDEIRRKHNIQPDDFLIMTGGKIDRAKTQTLLLMEAVRNIQNEHVKLIVFGSVEEFMREKFYSLVDDVNVQYIGWVEARDSYKVFAASDLVVFPGRHSVFWEQVTGLGIPMLCKDWEGTHHVDLGGNVRFLTQDSTQEIQREIERLINFPEEYKRMKSVALNEGIKTFSYKNIARQSIEE
ncbi:MAG: glycosyltransferase family 4 protein [Synergistaceae bacterium]|nr:glycosyltransferase family 4 protein [Synergistaceae bacterium]